MQHVLVIHKVENYDKWEPVYDENTVYHDHSSFKGFHVF